MIRRVQRFVVRLVAVVCVVILCTTATPVPGPTAAAPSSPANAEGPIIIVMDTSSSMTTKVGNTGRTRIEEARSAVIDTVADLPSDSQFGLISYPGSGTVVDGCSIGNEAVKVGQINKVSVANAVRNLTPDGDTPTAPALQHAGSLIKKAGGRGTIILVSDGESNCGDDVCEVAKTLSSMGAGVTAHSIGFEISDEGRAELQCVADLLHGQFVDVGEGDNLGPVLSELSGAKLEFDVTMPTDMRTVAGSGESGSTVSVTVRNIGQRTANDVRMSLDFRDGLGRSNRLPVPRPVRFLGSIELGKQRTIKFTVRPNEQTQPGDYTGFVSVSARLTRPGVKQAKTHVRNTGDLAGVLRGARDIVVLGDSYSSGEGTGVYIDGSDGTADGANRCHRSKESFGALLDRGAEVIACSGAVTADFYAGQKSNGEKMTPQLFALRKRVDKGDVPDAVLLSIGGNDIGFTDLARNCIVLFPDKCSKTAGESHLNVYSLLNDLIRVYRDVDRAVNDSKARARRGGRSAPIVVVPYPRILPTQDRIATSIIRLTPGQTWGCIPGVDPLEAGVLNTVIDALNSRVKRAVEVMQASHRPVYFATDVIDSFQPRHTVCDGQDTYAVKDDLVGRIFNGTLAEAAHPNIAGHKAMATAIAAWSASATPVKEESSTVEWKPVQNAQKNWFDKAASTIVKPLDTLFTEAGGMTSAVADGYFSNGEVRFYTHSTTRLVGTARADSAGHVDAELEIPTDMPPGMHHIEIVGLDAEGKPHSETRSIYIAPRYSGIALVVLVISILTVLVAAISIRRARKRRL